MKEKITKTEYENFFKKINQKLSACIFLVLLGIAIPMLMLEFLQESKIWIAGVVSGIFVLLSFAILLLVGKQNKAYHQLHPQIQESFYSPKERKEAKEKWKDSIIKSILIMAIGVICVLGVYLFLPQDEITFLPIAIFFFLLSFIFPIPAFWKLEEEKMDLEKYNQESRQKEKRGLIIANASMLVTIIISVGIYVMFHNIDISLILFTLGSVISIAISKMMLKKEKQKDEEK